MTYRELRRRSALGACRAEGCRQGRRNDRTPYCASHHYRWRRYGHLEAGVGAPWFPDVYLEYRWVRERWKGDRQRRAAWTLAGAKAAREFLLYTRGPHRLAELLRDTWPYSLTGRGFGSAFWIAQACAAPVIFRTSPERDPERWPMSDRTCAASANSVLLEAYVQQHGDRGRRGPRRQVWRLLRDSPTLAARIQEANAEHYEAEAMAYLAERAQGIEPDPADIERRRQLREWFTVDMPARSRAKARSRGRA